MTSNLTPYHVKSDACDVKNEALDVKFDVNNVKFDANNPKFDVLGSWEAENNSRGFLE
jgi:hypothetical protein